MLWKTIKFSLISVVSLVVGLCLSVYGDEYLVWDEIAGATGYRLYYKNHDDIQCEGVLYTTVMDNLGKQGGAVDSYYEVTDSKITSLKFDSLPLDEETVYCIVVTSFNNEGDESVVSNIVARVQRDSTPPMPPQNLRE
jgi:hypothetical protein